MKNYEKLLGLLYNEIAGGKRAIIGGGKTIDEAKCLELINSIRENLPQDVTEAYYVVEDRESIISNANRQAREIIENAQAKANQMVMESEIVNRASRDADNIVSEAQGYSQYIEVETKAAIDSIFGEAENRLGTILSDIRKCREDLVHEKLRK